MGGLSFLSGASQQKDSMWLARFELNGYLVRGVVCIVYCVKHSLTDAYRVGAEFRDLETRYQHVIDEYLAER